MPIEITMPRLSDTMETGTIIKWDVAEGDKVSAGDVIADIETDKATMEMQVFDDGIMDKILVPEGQTTDVGTVIALLSEDEGGDEDEEEAEAPPPPPAKAKAERVPDGSRVKISPVARLMADEHHLDLRQVQGSGPGGRIIKRDILNALETGAETAAAVPPSATPPETVASTSGRREIESTPSPPPAPTAVEATIVESSSAAMPVVPVMGGSMLQEQIVPVNNMRQTIARRLVESKTTVPHYQVTCTFNMDPLLGMRTQLNEQLANQQVKLSVNDFLVRCCALAMYDNPYFNASWQGESIKIHGAINIGVAISLPAEKGGGLVVGVIRHADQKSLRAISAETRYLAEKARTRGLTLEEMSDSTFTISNLGMFGVDHFTAIINPPNSAIMAVGAAIQKPVVRDGELAVGHEMSATLSSDHRVIDGAMAAQYLASLRDYLEQPAALLV